MVKANTIIALTLATVAAMTGNQLFAISKQDAFAISCEYIRNHYAIENLVYKGKYDEARKTWTAARKKIVRNADGLARARRDFLAYDNAGAAQTIEEALFDSWITNRVGKTTITFRDVLTDSSIIETRRKMYFDKYGLGDEIRAAYFDPTPIGDNSEKHLLWEFVPWQMGIDGSTEDGIVRYLGGCFVGKDGNPDKRRSEIARYVWSQRGKYRKLFKDTRATRMFLMFLYERMDDPNEYMDELKKSEKLVASAVHEKGRPLDYTEAEELIPKKQRKWEHKKSVRGRVRRVMDGDTFVLEPSHGGEDIVVRLDKIDAPEKGQPFGKEAMECLAGWIGHYDITVGYSKTDRYGRILGSVYTGGDIYVNLRMVADGFAWHYTEYDNSEEFADAEADARFYGLNLWSEPSPVKPSEWRRRNVLTDSDTLKTYGM